jgi:hypothetical protein
MTVRTIHLALSIRDHLDDSVQNIACTQALYDEVKGQLNYIELETQIKVEIIYIQDGFIFKRWGESETVLNLQLQRYAPFKVGSPAISGQAWLESYHISPSNLQLEYRLFVDQQLMTHRTLMYTLSEAEA